MVSGGLKFTTDMTWENRKFWLESQMVCAILFGELQKHGL